MNCTKAIIPVAGYGTRRLPITKAIEKCMLPVGNRPVVDYVVEDCIKAGITDIIFVVGEQFDQLQTFYGRNQLLEEYLADKGKNAQLQEVIDLSKKAKFHYVVQDQHQPYGTAVPVALCADMIGKDEQVLIYMGDDFIYNPDGSSEAQRLVDAVKNSGATAGLLAVSIPQADVGRYGVIEMQKTNGAELFKRIVEKPKASEAPSNLINVSKYIFNYELVQATRGVVGTEPAADGEYQVITPLAAYAAAGNPVTVVPAAGRYLDGGTVDGWLHANNVILSSRDSK